MRRDEFMRELEYLLQDIPDEEKGDAVAYYQDYLDEAGPENEEEVLQSFGSPERIAAIIRADLNGNLEEGGEFTDHGYEDQRFREPNFQLVKRLDLPEQADGREQTAGNAETGTDSDSFRYGSCERGRGAGAGRGAFQSGHGYSGYGNWTGRFQRGTVHPSGSQDGQSVHPDGAAAGRSAHGAGRPRWSWWQILGMVVLGCFVVPIAIPLLLGLGGGAIGLIVGLGGGAVGLVAAAGGILAALTIALAAVTFALLLAGALLVIVGIGHLANPVQGFLYIGTGVGILGIGLLCLALCGLYYGRFLPWLGRAVIDGISRLIHRKGASAA